MLFANLKNNFMLLEETKELQNELNTIFSNSFLCSSIVQVDASGKTYSIVAPPLQAGGAATVVPQLSPNSVYKKYLTIVASTINGWGNQFSSAVTGAVVPNTSRSQFTIQVSFTNNAKITQSVSADVVYTLGAGNTLQTCGLYVPPQTACVQSGAQWFPGADASTPGRCGICEKIGGIWDTTAGKGNCKI